MLRALTPVPTLVLLSTDELFKQFIKAYLKAETHLAQPKPWEKSLKSCFPDFYWDNLHHDYYCFCQQYKDHFKIVGANGSNYIPFTAFLFQRLVV